MLDVGLYVQSVAYTEGLQRPGANALIDAPPPRHIGLHGWRLWGSGCAPPPFGKSCIRPWGEKRQANKTKIRGERSIAYATFATRLIRATAMKSLYLFA